MLSLKLYTWKLSQFNTSYQVNKAYRNWEPSEETELKTCDPSRIFNRDKMLFAHVYFGFQIWGNANIEQQQL